MVETEIERLRRHITSLQKIDLTDERFSVRLAVSEVLEEKRIRLAEIAADAPRPPLRKLEHEIGLYGRFLPSDTPLEVLDLGFREIFRGTYAEYLAWCADGRPQLVDKDKA